jgi:hypothetical protein
MSCCLHFSKGDALSVRVNGKWNRAVVIDRTWFVLVVVTNTELLRIPAKAVPEYVRPIAVVLCDEQIARTA